MIPGKSPLPGTCTYHLHAGYMPATCRMYDARLPAVPCRLYAGSVPSAVQVGTAKASPPACRPSCRSMPGQYVARCQKRCPQRNLQHAHNMPPWDYGSTPPIVFAQKGFPMGICKKDPPIVFAH